MIKVFLYIGLYIALFGLFAEVFQKSKSLYYNHPVKWNDDWFGTLFCIFWFISIPLYILYIGWVIGCAIGAAIAKKIYTKRNKQ